MLSALRSENSPFSEQQIAQLQSSLGTLDAQQSLWLSGFLAGSLAVAETAPAAPKAESRATPALTVLYGTETGNGEAIARELAHAAKQQGIAAEVLSLANFRPSRLRKLGHAAFVISTHGEGDPPEDAVELFDYLAREDAAALVDLHYRVLALGDRSYPLFCAAGRQLEEHLQRLGAKAFGGRLECDVDYHQRAEQWSREVIDYAQQNLAGSQKEPTPSRLSVVPSKPLWDRRNPCPATVRRLQKITDQGSSKDVCHLELALPGAGLEYEPGDSLGVWAVNDPELVEQILNRLGIEAAAPVEVAGHSLSIREALGNHLEITRLSADTVLQLADAGRQDGLRHWFAGLQTAEQQAFLEQRQLADIVAEYPLEIDARSLAGALRPLSPRSYSIASSRRQADDEIHLTVATASSNAIGVQRFGAASGYLNRRLRPGAEVRVFVESNRRFRLPQDSGAPIIMIAAGTGIAPFRAFMQELEQVENAPDAWLVFGNPHRRTDFLYQREWLQWRATGLVRRIDAAWSRDQAEKRYVQHIVREQSGRLERWLSRGAHIYLCGSLDMGKAVMDALRENLAAERRIDSDAAEEVLRDLRRAGRIQKDLY